MGMVTSQDTGLRPGMVRSPVSLRPTRLSILSWPATTTKDASATSLVQVRLTAHNLGNLLPPHLQPQHLSQPPRQHPHQTLMCQMTDGAPGRPWKISATTLTTPLRASRGRDTRSIASLTSSKLNSSSSSLPPSTTESSKTELLLL